MHVAALRACNRRLQAAVFGEGRQQLALTAVVSECMHCMYAHAHENDCQELFGYIAHMQTELLDVANLVVVICISWMPVKTRLPGTVLLANTYRGHLCVVLALATLLSERHQRTPRLS